MFVIQNGKRYVADDTLEAGEKGEFTTSLNKAKLYSKRHEADSVMMPVNEVIIKVEVTVSRID
jgi:hypothetical protein